MSIEERIERLEQTNRLYRGLLGVACAALLVAVAASWLPGAAAQDEGSTPAETAADSEAAAEGAGEVLRATRLEIVKGDGEPVVTLGSDPEAGMLMISNNAGNPVLQLVGDSDGGLLLVNYADGSGTGALACVSW